MQKLLAIIAALFSLSVFVGWTHGETNFTTINCTGVKATDDAAFAAWETSAKAANPAITPLRITGNCNITSAFIFDGINNVVFSAYGAAITPFGIGPSATISNNYFLNSASIGDTSVVLNTAADSSNFTPGRYMIVTGLENQYPDCGTPPNTAFFDFVLITSITGTSTKTIHFSPALTNNYSSSWPLVCGDGPASAYPLAAGWDTDVKISGLSILATSEIVIRGRSISCVDCTLATDNINGSIAPTLADKISISNSFVGSMELDKLINTVTFTNVSGGLFHWLTQSATVKQYNLVNSSVSNLIGTTLHTSIVGGTYSNILAGPDGYGAAQSLSLDSVTVSTGQAGFAQVLKSATSYSSGTISMPLTDPNIGSFVHMAVPGFKYVLGDDHCPNCGVPQVAFTITNVRIDASNYYWDTDLLSVPVSLCSGVPCPRYQEFAAQTVTQVNTPGFDFTQWAAPP